MLPSGVASARPKGPVEPGRYPQSRHGADEVWGNEEGDHEYEADGEGIFAHMRDSTLSLPGHHLRVHLSIFPNRLNNWAECLLPLVRYVVDLKTS